MTASISIWFATPDPAKLAEDCSNYQRDHPSLTYFGFESQIHVSVDGEELRLSDDGGADSTLVGFATVLEKAWFDCQVNGLAEVVPPVPIQGWRGMKLVREADGVSVLVGQQVQSTAPRVAISAMQRAVDAFLASVRTLLLDVCPGTVEDIDWGPWLTNRSGRWWE